jgi:hypothetical protein
MAGLGRQSTSPICHCKYSGSPKCVNLGAMGCRVIAGTAGLYLTSDDAYAVAHAHEKRAESPVYLVRVRVIDCR